MAVFLPKIAAGDQIGFAAAGTGAVTFIAFALVAFGLAAALFVMTIRRRGTLSPVAKVVGMLPLPFTLAAALVLFVILRHQAEVEEAPPPTRAVTTPAPSL